MTIWQPLAVKNLLCNLLHEVLLQFGPKSLIHVFQGRPQFKCVCKHEIFCRLEPLKFVVAKCHSILGDAEKIFVGSRMPQFTVAKGHNI